MYQVVLCRRYGGALPPNGLLCPPHFDLLKILFSEYHMQRPDDITGIVPFPSLTRRWTRTEKEQYR